MATLLLVRHGQANASGDDYDQLTAHGIEQARNLGAYWTQRRLQVDRVFVGPCRRHAQTLAEVRSAYEQAGLAFPEPVATTALDELPAVTLTKRAAPALALRDERVARWLEDLLLANGRDDRALPRLVDHVTRLYAAGEVAFDDLESFAAFRGRVEAWIRESVQQSGQRGTVVAFTSGGPIGVAVGFALSLPDDKVIDVTGMVRNTSYSEFRFDAKRFSMASFNVHPHLAP